MLRISIFHASLISNTHYLKDTVEPGWGRGGGGLRGAKAL